MSPRFRGSSLAAVALAFSTACASTDPQATFEATAELATARGASGVVWARDDEARATALERTRELLAAPLTPESSAAVALLRNPGLQAELERLGVAQADLAQATRLANPGVTFSSLSGDGLSKRTVGLFADLVDWAVLPLRRRVAESELERVKLEVGDAIAATATSAKVALVRHQAAVQLAERLERVEALERAAAEFAEVLFAAGNLPERERAGARASWAESVAESARADLEASARREELLLALGVGVEESWEAAPELAPPPPLRLAGDELAARAASDRLDLAAARWAVGAIESALELRGVTRWSPVGVELGVEREWETDGARLTGPTVELRLPLFDTGAASVARLESELAISRRQLEALEARVASEVRMAARRVETADELVVLHRETILPERLTVLDQTLREYNQMLVGTFEVLVAKRAEVEAERAHVAALAEAWIARFELERAVAGLLERPERPEEEP